jgi:membrane protein
MAAVLEKLPAVRVGGVDVKNIATETVRETLDDDAMTLAAAMTYHTVLAVFPFLLLLAGLTSIIDTVFNVPDLTQQIVDRASKSLPDDATSVFEGFVQDVVEGRGGTAIGIGLVGTLWAASSAMSMAIKAMNRAYDVKKDRGFVRDKSLAVALTVGFGTMLLAGTLMFALGDNIARWAGDGVGSEQEFQWAWNALTTLLAFALVGAGVLFMYWLAPNTDIQIKSVAPGAALFLSTWLIFSFLFGLYISNFGSYNRVYGSLAAVIILLIWMYWSNVLLLVGAELNAVMARHFDEEYAADRRNANDERQHDAHGGAKGGSTDARHAS